MWESLLVPTYENYSLTDESKGILKDQTWDFFVNLKNNAAIYSTEVFMIPDTECQSQSEKWQFNRWF
jgi:hypothetical protein